MQQAGILRRLVGTPGDPQGKALARQHRDRTNKLIADAIAKHQDALSLLPNDDAKAIQR